MFQGLSKNTNFLKKYILFGIKKNNLKIISFAKKAIFYPNLWIFFTKMVKLY